MGPSKIAIHDLETCLEMSQFLVPVARGTDGKEFLREDDMFLDQNVYVQKIEDMTVMVQDLHRILLEQLRERKLSKPRNQTEMLALVVDPRCHDLHWLSDKMREEVYEVFRERVEEVRGALAGAGTTEQASEVAAVGRDPDEDVIKAMGVHGLKQKRMRMKQRFDSRKKIDLSTATDEVSEYLKMDTLSEDADPLEFFSKKCSPTLSESGQEIPPQFSAAMAHVFREGLSVCPHSCDAERMFRNGRLTLSDLRQSMKPSTFRQVMFVNGNVDRLKDVAAFKAALKPKKSIPKSKK